MSANQKALDLIELCRKGWGDWHFNTRSAFACSEAHMVYETIQYYWTMADRLEKEGVIAKGINLPEGYSSKDFENAANLFLSLNKNDKGLRRHFSMCEEA